MDNKQVVLAHIDDIHTTDMGVNRIKKNLMIDGNAIEYCKDIIRNENSVVYKKGKNYYCEMNDTIITIHSHSFTIITAHKKGDRHPKMGQI